MDPQPVLCERVGPVAIVRLNRPDKHNAINRAMSLALAAAMADLEADEAIRVIVLTGAGDRAFCAGNDLKFQASVGAKLEVPRTGFAGLTARFDNPKPVIAAVNGVAMGGGFEIALACDLIVAAEGATFALPEPRVGLAALAGGIHRLPRQIGQEHAMGMLLTGRRVSAAEGACLGFVNEVVPAAELLAAAKRWAASILECAPLSVRASKEAALAGLDRPLEEAMSARYEGLARMVKSEDFVEGPRAFAEKRKPEWKGR